MLKLYAQAAIYSPPAYSINEVSTLPVLPSGSSEKKLRINPKHCQQYNRLSDWQNGLAAVVHPNYIQTLSLSMQLNMMVTEPFPFKPMGLVHIANQIDVQFLPEQSANLQLSTRFGNVYFHRRGWLFEVITRAEVQGVEAVSGVSFYLARHKHCQQTLRSFGQADKHKLENTDKPSTFDMPAWITQLGQTKHDSHNAQQELQFSPDIGRRYAKVSGDYNPIHLYPYTAKLLGFKKAIAHGMYSKAWCISKLAQKSRFYQRGFSLKTVFVQPIMLPLLTQLYQSNQRSDNASDVLLFSLASNKGNKNRLHLAGTIEPYVKH